MLTLQLKYLKKQLHIKKRPYKPFFIRLKKSAHKIKPFEYLLKAKTLGFEAFNFRCSSCEICFANFYVAVVQCRPVRRNSTFRRHGLTSACFFVFAYSSQSTAQTSKVWRWWQTLNFFWHSPKKFYAYCIRQITKSKILDLS